jgi:hypothetical protein
VVQIWIQCTIMEIILLAFGSLLAFIVSIYKK